MSFVLQVAGPQETWKAVGELERARPLQEATLCGDAMPAATPEWMLTHWTPVTAHWNVLTRLQPEDGRDAA